MIAVILVFGPGMWLAFRVSTTYFPDNFWVGVLLLGAAVIGPQIALAIWVENTRKNRVMRQKKC